MRDSTDQPYNVVSSQQYSRVCICTRLLRFEDSNQVTAWPYVGDRRYPDDSIGFMIPYYIVLQIMLALGLGLDMWFITDSQIILIFKLFIVIEVLYLTALVLVKAAILCFFLRIFPDHKFRIAVKCTMVFNALIWVGFFIFVFFQIQPFSLFWNGWQQKKGHLILTGFTNFTLPLAGINLVLDVWMLILPMTQLWGMGLKLKKKLGVISMFSVGILWTLDGKYMYYGFICDESWDNVDNKRWEKG
ncbi:integral membrane protein [Fusarium mexicanum]|uniref:Integral membrane protein n=1 Tax=Fusarium mexicanum TaxID=751941 RepID=A0A8H5IYP3_9HYPO|nr:integral membrane protein [Fusarium mexicanum]